MTIAVKVDSRETDSSGKVVIARRTQVLVKSRLSARSAEARMPFFRSVDRGMLTDRKKVPPGFRINNTQVTGKVTDYVQYDLMKLSNIKT